jgi:chemotaxis protein MotB
MGLLAIRHTQRSMHVYRAWGTPPLLVVAAELRATFDPSGTVRIEETPDGIVVDFTANALFETGIAEPTAGGREPLIAAARLIASTDYLVTLEGHTDTAPISTRVFASNWELSAARAAAVARLFEAEGVAGGRLTAQGFGPNRPVAGNDTAEGRARNRRVMAILKDPPSTP